MQLIARKIAFAWTTSVEAELELLGRVCGEVVTVADNTWTLYVVLLIPENLIARQSHAALDVCSAHVA